MSAGAKYDIAITKLNALFACLTLPWGTDSPSFTTTSPWGQLRSVHVVFLARDLDQSPKVFSFESPDPSLPPGDPGPRFTA